MPPSPKTASVQRLLGACLAVLCLLGTIFVLPGPDAVAQPRKQTEQQLKEYTRKLKAAQAEATQLGKDITRLKGEVQQIRAKVDGLKGEVIVAQAEYDKLVRELEATAEEQDATQADLNDVRGDMDRRARSAFIAGPTGGLELMLGSQSFQDMAERSTFLNALQAQDANTAGTIKEVAADLHDLAVEQRKKAREAELALRYLEKQKEDLRIEAENEAAKVEELNKELHAANQLVKKWGHKVKITVEKLGYDVGGNGPLFSCPAPDYNYIADGFGDPRYTGGYHPHAGNDIPAPMGSDIVAPFDGVAKDASNTIGGTAIYVYGKDGYVYMAHNSANVKYGRVKAGEVIAKIGMSGNAAGTLPHTHFEWHPNNGDAVDPNPYLLEVCHK